MGRHLHHPMLSPCRCQPHAKTLHIAQMEGPLTASSLPFAAAKLISHCNITQCSDGRPCDHLLFGPCSYDVNVTPDKRKVLLHSEQSIVAAFQQVSAPQEQRLVPSSASGALHGQPLGSMETPRCLSNTFGKRLIVQIPSSSVSGAPRRQRWRLQASLIMCPSSISLSLPLMLSVPSSASKAAGPMSSHCAAASCTAVAWRGP